MPVPGAAVHITATDRDALLRGLGLSSDIIVETVSRAVSDADSCSLHDPPMLTGTMRWGRAVRYLRDALCPLGWTPDDRENFSLCVSPSGTVVLGVATGGGGAGFPDRLDVRTRYPKGPITMAYIQRNGVQLSLFEPEPELLSLGVSQYWMLLLNQVPGEMRFELSLPRSASPDGHVSDWAERIVFEPLASTGSPSPVDVHAVEDEELIVRRRDGV